MSTLTNRSRPSAAPSAKGRAGAPRGFTLIELMITVAVVAILAAVAYPSYREQIAKGRRAQATAELLGGQQWMERFYSENFRYDVNSGGTATAGATGLFAQRFPQIPADGGASTYTPRLNVPVAAQAYTITATRTGAMTGDRCGDFTIDHLGTRSIVAGTFDASVFANLNAAVAACWRQ